MNQQREIIYAQRRQVLMGENMSASIQGMIESIATGILEEISAAGKYPEEWDLDLLQQRMNEAFFIFSLLTFGFFTASSSPWEAFKISVRSCGFSTMVEDLRESL